MPKFLLSLNILKILYLRLFLNYSWATQGVSSPEDQRKIQIFDSMLLHNSNKARTEQ